MREGREVVLITGATGFVGSAVARALPDREIVIVSRKGPMTWDHLDVDGVDAIVNLAGETIAGRWNDRKKQAIRASRIEGTRALVAAIARATNKPRTLVSASAVGIYGETFEEVDETSPTGDDFLARVCVEWEAEADRAGIRVVKPRLGLVLGGGGGLLSQLTPLFRAGLGGPIGGGKQWWSWVHLDDVVAAIVRAIDDASWSGAVNLVGGALPQREFARTLGDALHRPSFMPTPAFAMRAALGDGADPILLGQRVVARRTASLGYRFIHTELRSAVDLALKAAVSRDGT